MLFYYIARMRDLVGFTGAGGYSASQGVIANGFPEGQGVVPESLRAAFENGI
jgi:hypothetical protein